MCSVSHTNLYLFYREMQDQKSVELSCSWNRFLTYSLCCQCISQTDVWNSWGKSQALLCPIHLLPINELGSLLHFSFYLFLLLLPLDVKSWGPRTFILVYFHLIFRENNDPVTFWTSSWVGNGSPFHHSPLCESRFSCCWGSWLASIRHSSFQTRSCYK